MLHRLIATCIVNLSDWMSYYNIIIFNVGNATGQAWTIKQANPISLRHTSCYWREMGIRGFHLAPYIGDISTVKPIFMRIVSWSMDALYGIEFCLRWQPVDVIAGCWCWLRDWRQRRALICVRMLRWDHRMAGWPVGQRGWDARLWLRWTNGAC